MTTLRCSEVRFVKELYPRLKPIDDVIERYRDAIENLPPITVARDNILVDGYHRWQAHVRENSEIIRVENLGNLADIEIIRESIQRNAQHGQQLSRPDKKRAASQLWQSLSHLPNGERIDDIADLLAVSRDSIERWTKDARQIEKQQQQEKAWDLWLNCLSYREIAAEMDIDNKTVAAWCAEFSANADFSAPPASRQHFDIWSFPSADKDAGSQSYFGALPPQIVENILWFWTEPGQIVVDPFAGSGTTIDVAKAMGRRVWASDIRGNHYAPHLPIHRHDILNGWPEDSPKKADIVLLDPPYWRQASGKYSADPNEMAEMDLMEFYYAWHNIIDILPKHTARIAYIISPTQIDEGAVIDHATDMIAPFQRLGWTIERRIIVPYQTQQATGQQVTWARENKRMLKLYRDLVVMTP